MIFFKLKNKKVRWRIDRLQLIFLFLIVSSFSFLSFPYLSEASTTVINEPTDSSAINETSISVTGSVTDAGEITSISNVVNFTIDSTAPTIMISSPLDGDYLNRLKIQGSSEPFLTVKVLLNEVEYITNADADGYWYILNEELMEGTYEVYAQAIDPAGNVGQSSTHQFTFDPIRPRVSLAMSPPPNMTRVDINSSVRIQIEDSSPLDSTIISEAIELFLGEDDTNIENKVSGVVSFDEVNKLFTFTPSEPLLSLTKYKVRVNPQLADQAGNLVYPRFWTFTTYGIYYDDNPHGAYLTNTNSCKNCHSNHRSLGTKLQAPMFTSEQENDNFCNACHDGTAAPIPSNWNSLNKHNYKVIDDENDQVSTSCTACHNPHVTWSQENPNLLLDAYYYEHNDPTNQFLPNNSREELCESCHEPTIYAHENVNYQVLSNKQWHDSTGNSTDYNLCLNCHNGSSSVDIASYYNGSSKHQITAQDGSLLAGHIPCSECHNEHGSNNLKLLRTNIGHSKTKEFQTTSLEWDIATERLFCNSCHNNETELFGITVSFDSNIEGHQSSSQTHCHECHGGSAIAAAHGPSLPNE